MKSRRKSEISESEDSDEAPGPQNSSIAKTPVVNNNASSSSSSDSSSDSEQAPKRSSSLLNQTPPSTSPKKTVSVSPIKKFIEQNPDLTPVHVDDVLSEDDDVCFLEIPKTIDPRQLLGKVINFDKRTKIKVDKTRYVIEPSDEIVRPFTILTNKLKVVHPIANLQLREYTKRKSGDDLVESEKFTVALPDNLKIRHPLFGAGYENKIVLDEEIQRRLDNTIDQFMKKMKKKKKKHKEGVQEDDREQNESIFTLLESHSTGKKKNKHKEKNERNPELIHLSLGEGGNSDEDQSFKKKHKHKKKKKKEAEDEQFTLPSFEEPENYKMKNEINIDNIAVSSNELIRHLFLNDEEDKDKSFKKKRKKKKKSKGENEEEVTLSSSEEPKDYKVFNTVGNTAVSSVNTSTNQYNTPSTSDNIAVPSNELIRHSFLNDEEDKDQSFKKKRKKKKKSKGENEEELTLPSSEEPKDYKVFNNVSNTSVSSVNTSTNQYNTPSTSSLKEDSFKKKKRAEDEETSQRKIKKNNLMNSTTIPGLQLPSFSFDISSIMNKEEKAVKSDKVRNYADDSGDEFRLDEEKSKEKRKKSASCDDLNSSMKQEQLDCVEDTSSIRKKKKKKRDKSDDEDGGFSPKKKHKKDKKEREVNLISDILSRVKHEMGDFS